MEERTERMLDALRLFAEIRSYRDFFDTVDAIIRDPRLNAVEVYARIHREVEAIKDTQRPSNEREKV